MRISDWSSDVCSSDLIDFRGSVDIPLIEDRLVASLAVSTKHRDGYQRRIPYTGYTDQNPIYLLATGGTSGGPANTNSFEGDLYPITSQKRPDRSRSEEHTSELQSLMRISYAVFCLKKKLRQRKRTK